MYRNVFYLFMYYVLTYLILSILPLGSHSGKYYLILCRKSCPLNSKTGAPDLTLGSGGGPTSQLWDLQVIYPF